jgi:serine phosphatase RsbU (regulator of sigma subunit)
VFCSDGVFEANDALGREFGVDRLLDVVRRVRNESARAIVDTIFTEVQDFRGDAVPNDDMTAVVLRITA